VALFVNTVAFECRRAVSSALRSLRCTRGVRLSRAPWWNSPTTLSVRHPIYEQDHWNRPMWKKITWIRPFSYQFSMIHVNC